MSAVPSTPVLDTFPVDGALSASWSTPIGFGDEAPTISSGVVIDSNGIFGSAYWNVSTYNDQESYLQTAGTGESRITLYTRISSPGASVNCFYSSFDASTGLGMGRVVGGAATTLYTNPSVLIGALSSVGIWMQALTSGNDVTISSYYNLGSGYILGGKYTDTNILSGTPALASGYIGFRQYGIGDTRYSFDNFGGGAATAYSGYVVFDPTKHPRMNMRH